MSKKPTVYHVKPAPRRVGEGPLLVPFPASQSKGTKRYLHADGETVECRTSVERLWWKSLVQHKDVVVIKPEEVKGKKFTQQKPTPAPSVAPTPVEVKPRGNRSSSQ